MLSDWISRPCTELKLPDMSPRHCPEIFFRPDTCSIRFNPSDDLVIFRLSGPRILNGRPARGIVDSWEWDRTRDDISKLVSTVVKWIAEWGNE